MVEKLKAAGGISMPLEAHVLSSTVPNAFALPGGKVYLLDGLLQKAESPDEIAGVLAHELGHVHHRDGLRRLIQTGGTSFLIGLLFGDVTGGSAVVFAGTLAVRRVLFARRRSAAADAFAIDVDAQARPFAEAAGRPCWCASPATRRATASRCSRLTR